MAVVNVGGIFSSTAPVFNARAYGAIGDGTTDDTTAIQAAMNACNTAGGGTVLLPFTNTGYVIKRGSTSGRQGVANQQGGINGYPGCSLIGQNTKLILRDNCAFIFYDPEIVATVTIATITADTVVGQTNFVVDSSSGFAVNDDVYFRLGPDTTNPPEAQYFGFAKVSAIPDSTHLTLDRPLNQAMTVVATQAYDRQIFKSSLGFPQNIEIGGFQLFTDQANAGNAEFGISCAYCRNIHIHDIQATDPGAAAVQLQFVENITVDNVNVLSSFAFGVPSKGGGIGAAEASNVLFTNIRISKFDTRALTVEAFSKNIQIKNFQTVNNTTAPQTGVIEVSIGQGCEVYVDGWRIEGLASKAIVDAGTSSGSVWAGNVNINVIGMVTIEPSVLANMWGKLVWTNGNANVSTMYGIYSTPRTWSGQLPLVVNGSSVLNLPDGLYKKYRIFASNTTGITGTFATTPGNLHNGPDITSSLSAGNTVDITAGGWVGIGPGGSNQNTWGLTGKTLTVTTNGTVLAGTYLTIWIEYYPLDGASSARTVALQDLTNLISPTIAGATPIVGAGQIGLGGAVTTTVGATGAASVLPANPVGYLIINIAGTPMKIPYYNN